MAENLSETGPGKLFHPSTTDAELEETTEEVEDETVDSEDEELTSDDELDDGEGETLEEEISTDELKEMRLALKNSKELQSLTTKKTQAAADQMKLATVELGKFQSLNSSLQESVVAMEIMLNEEESSIDWDELADVDPGEALKLERKFKKRRAEIKSARVKLDDAKKQADQANALREGTKLTELVPDWFTSKGLPTPQQKKDTTEIAEYLDNNDYENGYFNKITTAKEWVTLNKAAKYEALQKKKSGIKKKVTKIKTVGEKGKPAAEQSEADLNKLFYG